MGSNRQTVVDHGGAPAADIPSQIEALRPQLLRIARLQLRDHDAAEDAVQDAVLAALKDAPNFAGRSSVKTWLVGILKHKIIDALRQKAGHATEPFDDETDSDDIESSFDARGHWARKPAEWENAEQQLERKQFFTVLDFCLDGLPPSQGRVFMLREVFELGADEICKMLGISSSNLWVLLYRARIRLRECLEQKWFIPERSAT